MFNSISLSFFILSLIYVVLYVFFFFFECSLGIYTIMIHFKTVALLL